MSKPTTTPPNTSPITRPKTVTYHIPTTPTTTSSPLKTTIHLPAHSPWTSGLHWHNNSTEYLHLLQGSIFVTLGTSTKIYTASSSSLSSSDVVVLEVAAGVRHNWGRAEEWMRHQRDSEFSRGGGKGDLGEEVVVEEWTEPGGIGKPLFFWNLNGVLTDSDSASTSNSSSVKMLRWVLGGWWVPFRLSVIFGELDNYPVFLSLEGRISEYFGKNMAVWMEHLAEYLITSSVLFLASIVGRMFGIQAVSEEKTPAGLWSAWMRAKNRKGKAV